MDHTQWPKLDQHVPEFLALSMNPGDLKSTRRDTLAWSEQKWCPALPKFWQVRILPVPRLQSTHQFFNDLVSLLIGETERLSYFSHRRICGRVTAR